MKLSYPHKMILGLLQSRYANTKLWIYPLLGRPAQTNQERQIFKTIFDLGSSARKLRIFEWGSGHSTIYYAEYLRRKGVDFLWHSIDNNRAWYEKVKAYIAERDLSTHVKLHLMEFQPFWEKPGWGALPPPCGAYAPKSENEVGYVEFPSHLGESFDIVIVDARFRKRCIRMAKDVLKANGIVVLHDAQKKHYHEELDIYKYNMFIDSGSWHFLQERPNQVWIGSMVDHQAFKRLKAS